MLDDALGEVREDPESGRRPADPGRGSTGPAGSHDTRRPSPRHLTFGIACSSQGRPSRSRHAGPDARHTTAWTGSRHAGGYRPGRPRAGRRGPPRAVPTASTFECTPSLPRTFFTVQHGRQIPSCAATHGRRAVGERGYTLFLRRACRGVPRALGASPDARDRRSTAAPASGRRAHRERPTGDDRVKSPRRRRTATRLHERRERELRRAGGGSAWPPSPGRPARPGRRDDGDLARPRNWADHDDVDVGVETSIAAASLWSAPGPSADRRRADQISGKAQALGHDEHATGSIPLQVVSTSGPELSHRGHRGRRPVNRLAHATSTPTCSSIAPTTRSTGSPGARRRRRRPGGKRSRILPVHRLPACLGCHVMEASPSRTRTRRRT